MTANQAQAQVYPGVTHAQTFQAAFTTGDDFLNLI
jgi:hypothetical protein